MRLLADENFPFPSVTFLAGKGYDIKAIAMENQSISDQAVLAIAISELRIILTFDKDFGALIFKRGYRPPERVIYLRLSDYTPITPGRLVHALLTRPNFSSAYRLTTFNGDFLRQRAY